ncbi:uncharacterized protein LOC124366808 [Homalodisca vitripennis]|uniref:uncharacterized protein LOC124366808 n=1 Tax=Homalodisca vitripennis TaxID=197043 RepID=UPI001EEA333B|nr:uncharacterized protein LOC124366808 [Homalodisca vitripennis]
MRHSSSTEQRLAESRAVWMSVCLFGKQQTLVLVVSRSVSVFCTLQSGRIFGKRQTLLHPHIRLCGWEIRTVHGFQFCHQSLIDYWVWSGLMSWCWISYNTMRMNQLFGTLLIPITKIEMKYTMHGKESKARWVTSFSCHRI